MTRRKTRRISTSLLSVLLNAGAAVLLLLVLGVGVRAGALTAQFWREAVGSVGAFLAVAAVIWFAALARSARLRHVTAAQRQTMAYLATVVGLLFIVTRFWFAATAATTAAAQGATAWLPLIDAAVLPLVAAVAAMQAGLLSPQAAWDARRLGGREINLVLLLSIAALLLLPGGAAGWADALLAPPEPGGSAAWFGVAETGSPWLATVTATGVALFCGQVSLHALRRPGAAVTVFAAVLFYQATANFVFAQASGAMGLDATAHFLAILAAVVMDAAYMIRIYAAEENRTLWYASSAGIVAAVGAALILLPRLAGYPAATPAAIVGVTVGSAALGLWCGWCGARLGRLYGARAWPPPAIS